MNDLYIKKQVVVLTWSVNGRETITIVQTSHRFCVSYITVANFCTRSKLSV